MTGPAFLRLSNDSLNTRDVTTLKNIHIVHFVLPVVIAYLAQGPLVELLQYLNVPPVLCPCFTTIKHSSNYHSFF